MPVDPTTFMAGVTTAGAVIEGAVSAATTVVDWVTGLFGGDKKSSEEMWQEARAKMSAAANTLAGAFNEAIQSAQTAATAGGRTAWLDAARGALTAYHSVLWPPKAQKTAFWSVSEHAAWTAKFYDMQGVLNQLEAPQAQKGFIDITSLIDEPAIEFPKLRSVLTTKKDVTGGFKITTGTVVAVILAVLAWRALAKK